MCHFKFSSSHIKKETIEITFNNRFTYCRISKILSLCLIIYIKNYNKIFYFFNLYYYTFRIQDLFYAHSKSLFRLVLKHHVCLVAIVLDNAKLSNNYLAGLTVFESTFLFCICSHTTHPSWSTSGRIRIITRVCTEKERMGVQLLDRMHCLVLVFQKIESWSTHVQIVFRDNP